MHSDCSSTYSGVEQSPNTSQFVQEVTLTSDIQPDSPVPEPDEDKPECDMEISAEWEDAAALLEQDPADEEWEHYDPELFETHPANEMDVDVATAEPMEEEHPVE